MLGNRALYVAEDHRDWYHSYGRNEASVYIELKPEQEAELDKGDVPRASKYGNFNFQTDHTGLHYFIFEGVCAFPKKKTCLSGHSGGAFRG